MMKKNRRGFSLMELLAVMAIMGVLATVAVTGYFSAVRSMTRRRTVSNFVATLQQARQRACIGGTRTAVVCFGEEVQNTWPNTYVICKALGRISSTSGGQIADEFTPLDLIIGKPPQNTENEEEFSFGARRIYNLSDQGWVSVKGYVKPGVVGFLESGITGTKIAISTNETLLWAFELAPGSGGQNFNMGDLYGVEASPVAKLSKNIYFSSKTTVMFNPDGSATTIGDAFKIVDRSVKDKEKTISTITVNDNGSIMGGDTVSLN